MDTDLSQIHDASLRILATSGLRVLHPDGLQRLRRRGLRVEADRVLFTPAQIERAIGQAPVRFTLHARNPAHTVEIGGDGCELAPGFGAPAVAAADGTCRPAALADFVTFVKLYHQSDGFHLNGGVIVQPADVPVAHGPAAMLYASLAFSDKCLMTGTGSDRQMRRLMGMLELVFGDRQALVDQPRAITIISLNSPLQIDRQQMESLLVYLEYGQPVIVSPGVLTGMTAPMTLAGALALSNAEVLATIAVCQVLQPGAPVVYGGSVARTDMQSGAFLTSDPDGALTTAVSARLARAYGLPCRGSGASTDAPGLCVQAGYESMFNCLTRRQAGLNLIVHAAGMVAALNAMSYEKFIVDLEITAMVDRLAAGVSIDAETLAVDVVNQVGPGGEYLTHDHTLAHCRDPFQPAIALRGAVDDPPAAQLERIRRRLEGMLAGYRRPDLPGEVDAGLLRLLAEDSLDMGWVDRIHR